MINNDQQLITEAKRVPEKFEALYRKYYSQVYNYFLYRTNFSKETAEELMQEVFLRAFKYLPKFKFQGYSYLTYLITIAKTVLSDYYQRLKRLEILSLAEAVTIPIDIIPTLEDKLDAEKLWLIVKQKLTKLEQEAVLLHYREDMPIKEVARVMKKTPNSVKLALVRARRKLGRWCALEQISQFRDIRKPYTKPRFLKS